jgi:hypothetical protein
MTGMITSGIIASVGMLANRYSEKVTVMSLLLVPAFLINVRLIAENMAAESA